MRSLEIAVVGAGIGGLAAASLLSRDGHRVTLVERFSTPRPLGSGLVVQPVGQAVLAEIGVLDRAAALGAEINRMLGHSGKRKALDVRYPATQPGLAMHRASLFDCLWQAMSTTDVKRITGIEVQSAPLMGDKRLIKGSVAADRPSPTGPASGHTPAEHEGAAEVTLGPFDLVIDASGAGSKLSPLVARPLIFGAIWGSMPWPEESRLPPDELRQAYHHAARMAGILPIGALPDDPTPRAAVFYSLDQAGMRAWAEGSTDFETWRQETGQFWPEMRPFLAALGRAQDMTLARYRHGSLAKPFAPHLALIGDSAHQASPQLGQGANMALLDAYALRLALRNAGGQSLYECLSRYARMRRWHLRFYQFFSALVTPAYQSHSRLLPVLRDHLMAPLSKMPVMRGQLTRLVAGNILPPLASVAFPARVGTAKPLPRMRGPALEE